MNKLNLLNPFKRICITIGELPTSYIESMSYYEGLTYLVNYLTNNVIPAVNENGAAVNELQDLYIELKGYVDNYFSDLNVQEEINNKLDDMAEQGQLTDIILEYLNLGGLTMFDTIADMKNTEHAIDGNYFETSGETSYDDGKRTLFRIRELQESDTVDEITLFALTNFNDLVAEKLFDYNITSLDNKIGELEDLDTSDQTDIVSAINEVNEKVGSLSELTTSSKTDTVVAINEVNSKVGDLTNLSTTNKTNVVAAINELNTYPLFNLTVFHQAYRTSSDGNTDAITLGKFNQNTNAFTTTNSGMSSVYCNIQGAQNSSGSVGKIYGQIYMTVSYSPSNTALPCIRLRCIDFGINVPDEGFTIWCAGSTYGNDAFSGASIYVGDDGYLYLYGGLVTTVADSAIYRTVFPPCIYFWSSFGDTPNVEE